MTTEDAFSVLNSRPEWIERCRSVAGINRDPVTGGQRLRDYALGAVTRSLDQAGDTASAQQLADEQVDWTELYRRFRRDHPFKRLFGP